MPPLTHRHSPPTHAAAAVLQSWRRRSCSGRCWGCAGTWPTWRGAACCCGCPPPSGRCCASQSAAGDAAFATSALPGTPSLPGPQPRTCWQAPCGRDVCTCNSQTHILAGTNVPLDQLLSSFIITPSLAHRRPVNPACTRPLCPRRPSANSFSLISCAAMLRPNPLLVALPPTLSLYTAPASPCASSLEDFAKFLAANNVHEQLGATCSLEGWQLSSAGP